MKDMLVLLLGLGWIIISSVRASAEGLVSFSNIGGSDAQKAWIDAVGVENGGSLAPAGATYRLALFYSPNGTIDDSQFLQVGDPTTIGPLPGIFSGGTRIVPVDPPGAPVYFQVRGWESAYGLTYQEFWDNAIPGAYFGKSHVFQLDTWCCNQGDPLPTLLRASDPGWTGFALTPIPEPSIVLIMIVGLTSLAYLRQRTRNN